MSSNLTVLGGGNTAFALAADLTLAGHSVRLAELPAMRDTIEPIRESRTIALDGVAHTGEARLAEVTTDIDGAVDGADLVLLSVPAYAHRPFAEACAPHLKAGQVLALAPGTLGSLEFAKVFEEMGNREDVVLAEVDTSPYVCRKTGPDAAHIWGVVPRLGVGVRPASLTAQVHSLLSPLFPGLTAYRSVLDCGFSSMNPIMHPAGILMNAGRVEYSDGDFYFYKEGVTPGVARVILEVDRERLAIGEALGLEILPVAEAFHNAGFGPAGDLETTITGSEMLTQLRAPGSLDTRWLLEDAPYGLVSWASIAEQIGVPTPTIRAVISLCSTLTGQDAWATGRLAEHLGLAGLNASEMVARATGETT